MRGERHFIERRNGRGGYQLVGPQPAQGFASPKDAIDWLAARGWIERRLHPDTGEPYWEGWGGERGFCTRAVPPTREEPVGEPVLVGSLSEYSIRFGAGPLRIPPVEPTDPRIFTWKANVEAAIAYAKRRLRRSDG